MEDVLKVQNVADQERDMGHHIIATNLQIFSARPPGKNISPETHSHVSLARG
jgi:hypothetical protein